MSFSSEFKEFIARGNVVDLAVGVVMGGAFGAIVTKFVEQIIMPFVGLMTGGVDIAGMKWVLKAADEAAKTPEIALGYGVVLSAIISFAIIALCVFSIVKIVNKLRKPAEAAAPAGPSAEELLAEIRDLLQK